MLLVADLGAALGALVQVEGVLCQAQLAEGVLAGGGHRMGEVIFAEQAKDGDAVEAGGVGGLLFLYLLGDDVELLLLFSLGLFLGLYLFGHADNDYQSSHPVNYFPYPCHESNCLFGWVPTNSTKMAIILLSPPPIV